MIVTPMIQPFWSTSGLHERDPIVPGVSEGYDTVEAVSRDRFVSTTSTAFLVVLAFLCVAVVTGGIIAGSSTWSPAVFRPVSSSATVLASVDVCIARVACVVRAISFLFLVFAFCPSPCFP